MARQSKVDSLSVARVCVRHPTARAHLVCTRCHRWQCKGCARPLTEGHDGPLGCALCGGVLRVGQLRRPPDSHEQLLWRALNLEGGATIFALSLPAFAIGFGSLIGAFFLVVYAGVLTSYYFQTAEHVGRGRAGLPFSAEVVTWGGLLGLLLRGFLTFGLCFGPAYLLTFVAPEQIVLQIFAALIGAALMPSAVLAGIVTNSPLNSLWPFVWVQIVARAPGSYLRLLGWVYGSTFVWAVVTGLLIWALAPVANVMFLVLPFFHTSFAVWQALLFGRFVQEESGSFGLMD